MKPAKTISVNYIILKSEKKELFKNNLDSIMAKENIENILKNCYVLQSFDKNE